MHAFARYLALTILLTGGSVAEPQNPAEKPGAKEGADVKEKLKDAEKSKADDKDKPKKSETKHSIQIGGQKIEYTATADLMPLKDKDGKTTTAKIFYVAYVKDGVSDPARRPLTFS